MLWVAHNKSITHPKLPFSNNGRKSPTQNTVPPSTALSSPRRLLLTTVRPGHRPASRGGPRRASGCWPLATVGSPRLTSYRPIIADARELGRGRETTLTCVPARLVRKIFSLILFYYSNQLRTKFDLIKKIS